MRSLEARIVALFVLLLVGMQFGALVITHATGVSNTRTRLVDKLVADERVREQLLELDRSRLSQAARLLASDMLLRAAIVSRNPDAVESLIRRQGARTDSELTLLVGLDQQIMADPRPTSLTGQQFPLKGLLLAAEKRGEASGIVKFDGALYQTIVVPVLDPEPIAWIVLGFTIDDADTRALHDLVGLEVSYLTKDAGSHWQMDTTTLHPALAAALVRRLDTLPVPASNEPSTWKVDDDEYLTLYVPLQSFGGSDSITVIQRSLRDYLEPFRDLEKALIEFAAVAMLIAVLCCFWVARGIVKPVKALSTFARRLASGDYSAPLKTDRSDEIGELVTAFDQMRDGITEREKKILDLAYRDALTSLPNRTLMHDRLGQVIASAQRIQRPASLLMVDLDRFKEINDLLGHAGGDAVLTEVARRLQQVFKRTSDTVARMGADEFAVLLPTEGRDSAITLAQKLLRNLELPFMLDGNAVDIRASVGIAVYPDHGADLETFTRNADSAMQVAKRNKTGYSIHDPQRERLSVERLSMMSDLRRAVEQNELVLYFQPQRDLRDPTQLSVEVLLRWQHPVRGMVPPDAFIPFAEQTGYISVITEWVLDRALSQAREWRVGGLDACVAVNISTRDLITPSFPATVAVLLEKHACPSQRLILEITETAILGDPELALQNMNRLHALGCQLSIDDFGTGYSSLAYLKRLPVDELKIDKSFVMNMAMDSSDSVIVRSTIDLGHNMGLKVVAEGVETLDVLHLLREMGCDVVQGYLISRPIDAAAMGRWGRGDRLSLVKPDVPVPAAAA